MAAGKSVVFWVLALLWAVATTAGEIRFAGIAGNSGEAGTSLCLTGGTVASGIGPVLDDAGTIWERSGDSRLSRYALDGRLVASYSLPTSTSRSDQMARAGDLLVLLLRDQLYTFPLPPQPDSKPDRLLQKVQAMSSNSRDGKVVICRENNLSWLEGKTGEITPIVAVDKAPSALFIGDDGTVYEFKESKVVGWRDGKLLDGYPKEFRGERPQQIGGWWYSHSWHGTINRFNSNFEPAPGVVLGGASGSFIGYLPQSTDIENGRGLVRIDGDHFAVSGLGGVVQILRWEAREKRFSVVRRLGALAELEGVAVDEGGTIWTPGGAWRWDDGAETPLTLGDVKPQTIAQPTMIGNRMLCLLKQHYSYIQLAHGPLLDGNGWAHYDIDEVKGFKFDETVTGAAVCQIEKNRLTLIVTRRNGDAVEIPVGADGNRAGNPVSIKLPGLTACSSLAWFGDKLVAADGRELVVYSRVDGAWQQKERRAFGTDSLHVHSDGKFLAVSDTGQHTVSLYDSPDHCLGIFGVAGQAGSTVDHLDTPTHVAVAGSRIVVYDSGNQRLVKLAWTDAPATAVADIVRTTAGPSARCKTFTDADYVELAPPGALTFAVAVDIASAGLSLSVRTTMTPGLNISFGVAGGGKAVTLTNANAKVTDHSFDFFVPGGDWQDLRLAATMSLPGAFGRSERIGFTDHRAIHLPFADDPAVWQAFDLDTYKQRVAEQAQEIWIEFDQPVDGKATIAIDNHAGFRVRNLISGEEFAAGHHRVQWDGITETGQLAQPDTYTWRGLTHPGIKPRFLMSFADGREPDSHLKRPWGPNHGTLQNAAGNGKLVFLAAPVTEGGWALMALDQDGKFVQGYDHQQGLGIGINAIAADDTYLYCAQDGFGWSGKRDIDFSKPWTAEWTITVVRFDVVTGKLVPFPNKKNALEVDKMTVGPGSDHPDLQAYNLGGLAVHDGKLFVGSRRQNVVFVLDAASGEVKNTIPAPAPRHLAAGKVGVLVAADNGVYRLGVDKPLVPAKGRDLTGITIAPDGQIFVSDGAAHRVVKFTADGKQVETYGIGDGPYAGAYEAEHLVNPAGLTIGPAGKLWLTENRWNPKRVMAWDLKSKQVVYEKFGMPHYGGVGGAVDPADESRWVGLGCLWHIDMAAGKGYPTHVLAKDEGHFKNYYPMSYTIFREKGRTFLSSRGKIALLSELRDDGTIKDLAAVACTHLFSYGCEWDPPQSYIDAFYKKWPERRKEEKAGPKGEGKPWAQRGPGLMWVDRNGDGLPQKEEFELGPLGVEFAGAAWGHRVDSLTFHLPAVVDGKVRLVTIAPKRFLANGVPDYPTLAESITAGTPVDMRPGYARTGIATATDRFGRFIFNSDPEMNAYAADGRHLWTYPNEWSNVHGSHKAPLPQTGVMQGTLGILGIAPFDTQADVFFLSGNHGRCFLLTSDGLYLDEVFTDVRVSYVNDAYRLGGEIFGGTFDRSEKTGTYYTQIGHGPYRIYALDGIANAHRMNGTLRITADQIAAAEQKSRRQMAATADVKEVQISRAVAAPRIDGDLKEWTGAPTAAWDQGGKFKSAFYAAADATNLYLAYRIQDPSPWINNGRDWTTLFATGDTVDLQIGTDPIANRKRNTPVAGDKRLLIAPFEDKPIAVLYEHRLPGGTNPVTFTSPWRAAKVDNVTRLENAEIAVKTSNDGYTIEATIPLATLGLKVDPNATYQADIGVTFGDPAGTETNLRSYWANPATMLVDDIPGEIMLTPNLWGSFRFAP